MGIIRIITTLVILGLGVYVTLSPQTEYAPTPRAVLFLFVAILPAILLADVATAHFKWRLPGFIATGGGSFAVMIIVLFALYYFTTSTDQIAVFHFTYEDREPVRGLDQEEAVDIHTSDGAPVESYIDGNSIVVFFPKGTATCRLTVRLGLMEYAGDLRYFGVRKPDLVLNTDGTIK